MKIKKPVAAGALALFTPTSCLPAVAQTFRIAGIDTLGSAYGQAYGVNDSGQVVGQYFSGTGPYCASLYSNGSITDLGLYRNNKDPFNMLLNMLGDGGSDTLFGGAGADQLLADAGDDGLLTYAELIARGFDLTGTAGNDSIVGTSVSDRIAGLGNDDLIWRLLATRENRRWRDGERKRFADNETTWRAAA